MKIGDVVQLKGQTIQMTVSAVNPAGGKQGVSVVWFDAEDQIRKETFQEEMLEVVGESA